MDKQTKKEQVANYLEREITGGVYALYHSKSGRRMLYAVSDLKGGQNRFLFAQNTNMCPDVRMKADWEQYGAQSFRFEILEQITKKPEQSNKEFKEELETLKELVLARFTPAELY